MTAVAYDAAYTEDHGADDTTSPERHLWLAVIAQAADDLFDSRERIRQDAANFFAGPDLLQVMVYAGIDCSCASLLREQARAICQQSGRLRRRRGVAYRGESHSYREWARITGLTVDTIVGRLRSGWSVKQALTTPGRQRAAPVA